MINWALWRRCLGRNKGDVANRDQDRKEHGCGSLAQQEPRVQPAELYRRFPIDDKSQLHSLNRETRPEIMPPFAVNPLGKRREAVGANTRAKAAEQRLTNCSPVTDAAPSESGKVGKARLAAAVVRPTLHSWR